MVQQLMVALATCVLVQAMVGHAHAQDAPRPCTLDQSHGTPHTVLSLDHAALAAAGGSTTLEQFPLPDGSSINLVLEPFSVFAPGARILVVDDAGERPADFDPSAITFWRGSVEGIPGSHVFLSIAEGSTIGRIELGASQPTFVVSSNGGDLSNGGVALSKGKVVVFEADSTFGPQTAPTLCGTATGTPDSIPPIGPYTPAPVGGLRMARLAIDSDYEFFELFNNEREALTYLAQLYATVSDVTIRDVGVRLDLVFLRLWTTPDDPYGPSVDFPYSLIGLADFEIAQLLSGSKLESVGGVAQLCNRFSFVAYATGQMSSPTSPSVFNQDFRIAAHEIGHNLGAPHTHDRGVDRCNIAHSRPRRGTIQSYCAQTFSGRAALTDLHYHTRMRQEINDCSPGRLDFDCNQNYLDDTLDVMLGTSEDANANGIPDECEDCNANGVLDPEDIAGGTSSDLNLNGIPDECEPDCNANGIPDDLDIANGNDENGDGIPDDCQADRNGNGLADWSDIFRDMSLDIDRDGVLDATQDCDGDGIMDIDALDHAHNIWAVSSGDGMAKEYHYRSGVLRAEAGENVLVDPTDVLITTDRRVLVADAGNASVVELDREGVYVRHLVRPGSGGLVAPSALAFAPDGSLLVADQGGDAVLRYDLATGAFRGVFIEAGAGGLVGPRAMAFKPEGNLFVTTDDARVLEFDRDSGAFVRVFITIEPDPDPRTIREPRGILFLPRPAGLGVRCLVACEYWVHGGIYEFHADTGALIGQWNEGDLFFKLRHPWGLRLGPDGNVYASSANLHEGPESPPTSQLDPHDPHNPHTPGLHLTRPHIFQYDGVSGKLISAYVQGGDSKLDHPKGFDFMPGPLDRNANAIPDACESVCIADCDRSGAVDILDFLCFQNAFTAGDPSADCTADGSIDIFDFLCFQTAFEDGCG